MKNVTTETVKTVVRKVWDNSSLLDSAEWSEGEMKISFKGGQQYRYSDVPLEEFHSLCEAESGGKFFHSNVRGKYTTEKIEQDDEQS